MRSALLAGLVSTVLLTFLLGSLAAHGAEPAASPWRAGSASVNVTPTEPMAMAGYAGRTKPSEGSALDLYCKALAIEHESGERLVIVTCDLIGIPRGLREALEDDVQEKFKLRPEQLLLNASHTHCGPQFRVTSEKPPADESASAKQARLYGEALRTKLATIIGQAIERLAPAKLDYSHARCGFAMNRRTPTEKGYQNNPWSEGPVDHDVPVLKVSGTDGKLKAVLFGYACHNTTLGFLQFCGDYAGFAQQHLEAKFPGATAHFLMGCGGDQNPYPRGELELARHHGKTLGIAVEAALGSAPLKPLRGPLKSALRTPTLEFAPPPPKEKLELLTKSPNKQEASHAGRLLAQLAKEGSIATTYDAPVQAVRFGDDLLLVAFPGETVVDFSLRAKRDFAAPSLSVWTAGYSNDVFGYIPSKRVLLEGGYEATGAMLYSRFPGPFGVDVEERLMKGAAEVVEAVRKK